MEAKAWNLRASGLARLEQRIPRWDVDLFTVNNDLGHDRLLNL